MWTIIKDFIDDGKAVGVSSPDFEVGVNLPFRFRMFDDDGILYYEGIGDDSESFDPLDDFGTGNAGATTIAYLKCGAFQPL